MNNYDSIRLTYWYGVFVNIQDPNQTHLAIIDRNSHPFIWIKIQKELHGIDYIVINWKEISADEYELAYHNFQSLKNSILKNDQ